jgi:uncharacterized protein (DUF1778 family)
MKEGDRVKTARKRKPAEAAEDAILKRTGVTIPAKHWEAFKAWIERPAKANPALAELARHTPSWER